jgi:hypothetical protein
MPREATLELAPLSIPLPERSIRCPGLVRSGVRQTLTSRKVAMAQQRCDRKTRTRFARLRCPRCWRRQAGSIYGLHGTARHA